LESLRGVAHTDVRRFVVALGEAAAGERVDLALALQPFGIDTTGVELFELERRARRVFALTTAEDGAPVAAPVAPPAPPAPVAPAPAASPPAAASRPPRDAGVPTGAAPRPAARDAGAPRAPSVASAPSDRAPMVSVIVPTHDRPAMLRTALES